jgi:hypothetical protein
VPTSAPTNPPGGSECGSNIPPGKCMKTQTAAASTP